ncbi:MAG: hypothetical protein MZV64_12420 [Ignavibacteriales bacterium]|nr:hypothetical protein [Ignavibacteriales bacterium]
MGSQVERAVRARRHPRQARVLSVQRLFPLRAAPLQTPRHSAQTRLRRDGWSFSRSRMQAACDYIRSTVAGSGQCSLHRASQCSTAHDQASQTAAELSSRGLSPRMDRLPVPPTPLYQTRVDSSHRWPRRIRMAREIA